MMSAMWGAKGAIVMMEVVVLLLLVILDRAYGFVRSQEWRYAADAFAGIDKGVVSSVTPAPGQEEGELQELFSCNPAKVIFRTEDIAPKRTLSSPLAQKRLQMPVFPSLSLVNDPSWEALRRSSRILFLGSSIIYFDPCLEQSSDGSSCESFHDGQTFVWSLDTSDQHDELFAATYEVGESRCSFDVSEAPQVPGDDLLSSECYIFRLFQKPYVERRSLLTFDARQPHSLASSADARYVAWVENDLAANESSYGGIGGSEIKVYDLDNHFMVADIDVNGFEALARAAYWEKLAVKNGSMSEHYFQSDGAASGLSVKRSHPAFCGDNFLLYEARLAETATNGDVAPPCVVLCDLRTTDRRAETLDIGAVFPVTSTTSSRIMEESLGLHTCTAAWVSGIGADGTFAGTDQTVSLLHLPSRELTIIPKRDWSDGRFNQLFDIALSGEHLFIVVFSAADQLYKIRFAHISHLSMFRDVFSSLSDTPLKVRTSGANSTVLYSKRGSMDDSTKDELHVIHFLHEIQDRAHCVLESQALRVGTDDGTSEEDKRRKKIVDVSLYRDAVVWLATYENSTDDTTLFLELTDLDKDNDMHFDFVDEFPFNYGFVKDTDEDGYADSMDFIDYPYYCDDYIMYASFLVFFVVNVSLVVCTFQLHQRLVKLRHQTALDDEDEQDEGSTNVLVLGFPERIAKRLSSKIRKTVFKRPSKQPPKQNTMQLSLRPSNSYLIKNTNNNSIKRRNVLFDSGAIDVDDQKYQLNFVQQKTIEAYSRAESNLGFFAWGFQSAGNSGGHGSNATTNVDHGIAVIHGLHTGAEVLLTILTVSSLFLAVYPSIPFGGVPLYVERQCIWADFFTFSLFCTDLVARYYTRNIKEQPTVGVFLRENWYDVPALLTDIPLTYLRFPNVLGFFKSFRIIRLYRRFTQQAAFVSLMVHRPMVYLATIVTVIIIVCALFIKILEQDAQEEFREFYTVLWFAMVTVTTVGYGDLYVLSGKTWILTFFLMIMGIGLISTLSAFCAERLLSIGKNEYIKRQMKAELENRAEMLRFGLMHVSAPYNPLSMALEGMIFRHKQKDGVTMNSGTDIVPSMNINFFKNTTLGHENSAFGTSSAYNLDNMLETSNVSALKTAWVGRNFEVVNRHMSSTLNVTRGMNNSFTLPVEHVLQSAGGKFRVQAITSQADLIRLAAKDHEQAMLLHVMRLRRGANPDTFGELSTPGVGSNNMENMLISKTANVGFSPRTRLHFLLLNFSLHKPERGGVHNFTEMADELADIIFEPHRPLGCYLEKVFAIDKAWNELKDRKKLDDSNATNTSENVKKIIECEATKFYHFEFRDPLHAKLARIDNHCKRYGIAQRTDYNEIITTITTLVLMHDRVSTVQWAMANLEYQVGKKRAKPILEEPVPPPAEMPATGVFLVKPQTTYKVRETSTEPKTPKRKLKKQQNSAY